MSSSPEATTCSGRCFHPESIEKARTLLPDFEHIKRLASLFSTLGDPTRLGILLALRSGELCVCDLSTIMSMSSSAISHQLRILRHLELVKSNKQGRMVMYRLADDHDHIARLLEWTLEYGKTHGLFMTMGSS